MNFDVNNFINESLTQLFSCEFCKISKNTFFTEHLWVTAYVSGCGFKSRRSHCLLVFGVRVLTSEVHVYYPCWLWCSTKNIFSILSRSKKNTKTQMRITMRKKCPYSELFWTIFSGIRTEHEEIQSISPYSVRIREYTNQNNSEYGRFSRSLKVSSSWKNYYARNLESVVTE